MSHIAVLCPHCESRYQLQPELVGKRMRCPNPLCREIFVVQEEGQAAAEPPPEPEPPATRPAAPETRPGQVSGTVGDLVPILPAERAELVREPQPKPEPVKKPSSPTPLAPAARVSEPEPAAPAASWLQPPPVREARPVVQPQPAPATRQTVPVEETAPPEQLEPVAPKPELVAATAETATDEPPTASPT